MLRISRTRASQALAVYVGLDLLLFVYTRTAGAALNAGHSVDVQLFWLALDVFLAWRVWQGGKIAWAILLLLNGWSFLALLLGTGLASLYVIGLAALAITQLTMLLSPAVRHHLQT